VAFLIEVIVDRAVNRGEFLQTAHSPEAEHRPFPSSERLVGILRPVVQPAANLALVDGAQNLECSTIGRQPISDDRLDRAMPLQRFPEEFRFAALRVNAAFLSHRFVTKLSSTSPS